MLSVYATFALDLSWLSSTLIGVTPVPGDMIPLLQYLKHCNYPRGKSIINIHIHIIKNKIKLKTKIYKLKLVLDKFLYKVENNVLNKNSTFTFFSYI